MTDNIDYGNKMHAAMRGLIADVLSEVARDGLPGEHHFFITFNTQHPDVEMTDWLFDRYPDEMTIVIQHWFDALFVSEDGFQITLNFGDSPEHLVIPFDALRTFVDPSVEFGLRFEAPDSDGEDGPHEVVEMPELDATPPATKPVKPKARPPASETASQPSEKEAEIVSLDSFRKT